MNTTVLSLASDLVIIGLPLRTSPETAAADIPKHWQKFMSEGLPGAIAANLAQATVHAVYCDYQSDCRGPYTMVLGVAVDAPTEVPPGLRRVRIPSGKYASFEATGDLTRSIWQAWVHINTNWEDRAKRRYIADFERYETAADGAPAAKILVGLE